jgi:Holliday junction DNA helicase RuvA
LIGQLRGILEEKIPPFVLVDVGGIGYEVQLPMSCFYLLPELGQPVSLITHFVVREDAQLLYGFHDKAARSMFRELIKVNGIGPKVALAILSGLNTQQLVNVVARDDLTGLTKIPGVGKKTAERLLVELKDRLKNWQVESPQTPTADAMYHNDQELTLATADPADEACEALVALGYKQAVAERIVKQIYKAGQTSESLIRDALKSMI